MQKAQEMWVCSLGWEDRLQKGMATLSSILSWEVSWTEEPSGIQSMGSQSGTRLHTHTHTHTRMRAHARCWKVSERRLLRTHSSVHTHTHTHTRARCWKGSERRLLRTHSSVAVGRRPPGIFWDYVNKISAASPGITVYMRMGRTHPKDREETCFPAAAPPSLQFSLGSPIPPLSLSIGMAPG